MTTGSSPELARAWLHENMLHGWHTDNLESLALLLDKVREDTLEEAAAKVQSIVDHHAKDETAFVEERSYAAALSACCSKHASSECVEAIRSLKATQP